MKRWKAKSCWRAMYCVVLFWMLSFVYEIVVFNTSTSRVRDYNFVLKKETLINHVLASQIERNYKRNTHLNAMGLIQLQQEWQRLFYYVFLKPKLMPPIRKMSIYSFNATQEEQRYGPKAPDIEHILNQTYSSLLHMHYDIDTLRILAEYKHIIAIRRYMMILLNNMDINITSHDHIQRIQHLFIELHFQYINEKNNKQPKYFAIHVSKSAGTTLCKVARDILHYNTTNPGLNCNLNGFGTSFKRPEFPKMSCSKIERLATLRHLQFFARERPLFPGDNIRNKPELCSEFIYILPFRNPLYRTASTLSEFSKDHYYPFQIMIKDENYQNKHVHKWITDVKRKYSVCESTVIDVEDENKTNHIYRSPEEGHDFATFIRDIFAYENDNKQSEHVVDGYRDNGDCSLFPFMNKRNAHLSGVWYDNDTVYMQWFGRKYSKYAVKISEHYKHQMNISLVRGYLSNIYSRFLGFEHRNERESLDAIFAKSNDISVDCMLNTAEIMMEIEHVLPFNDSFAHDIFQYTLHLMKPQQETLTHQLTWDVRETSIAQKLFSKRQIESSDIMKYWDKEEIEELKRKNLIDWQLFKLAQQIADVDVEFYALLK